MVTITEEAAQKVKGMLDGQTDKGLRLFVKPGGCSGFSYGLAIDDKKDSDQVLIKSGVPVLIDQDSVRFVTGAEIDYVESLVNTGFTIHNPNAVSTCGCGSSFRTNEEAGQPGSCD